MASASVLESRSCEACVVFRGSPTSQRFSSMRHYRTTDRRKEKTRRDRAGCRGLVSSVGCRKGVAGLAVVAIARRKHHLLGVEAVAGHVGLELSPNACLDRVHTGVIDTPAELAHRDNSSCRLRHQELPHALSVIAATTAVKGLGVLQGAESVHRAEFASAGLSGYWSVV